MIFVRENGRTIPKEDKIFGISNRAKEAIAKYGKDKVVNGTIGALMDDDGKLIVLKSVDKVFKTLTPDEYAPYAPIGGIPEFKEAIKKAAFGKYEPKGFTEVVATPGGTGGIRNTISNFSAPGDRVLVADWFWAPYRTIATEIGREIQTFKFFDEERKFNIEDFKANVLELLEAQESLVIIINSPAHNPTGYSLSVADWRNIKAIFEKTPQNKHVALFCDVAYIDFAGDEEEYRQFLPVLDEMPENVLPVIGYSASKTFTMYGMRCGAMICIAKTPAIAVEFKSACEFSSRGSWSNCNRAPQTVIAKIFADPELKKMVDDERAEYRDMLIRRGRAFEAAAKECGLEMVPFDAGFFASMPMPNPDEVAAELEKENIFLVPLAKGIRASVASMSEENCKMVPARIKACMEKLAK
ncbi:MAG: aminotransferase class I/II-fold pyridoxal phosphate-dependent enzyme [Clostridiales bacterium]|nr:aminotransferase class I/II-fold pyridoxal phosphate-dependent enzyme [Clostridiales bacterium]